MTDKAQPVKRLYVDALNQFECFSKYVEFWGCLFRLQSDVRAFVDSAKAAGIELKVFLDGNNRVGEALYKWKKRKRKEVLHGQRNVPHGFVKLVADAFRACGVEVHFSWSHDNDTTVAAWAHLDGAAILSKDHDFFRYEGRSYRVYKTYTVSYAGKLLLPEQAYPSKPIFPLTIPLVRPKTLFSRPFIHKDSSLHPTAFVHIGGVPSALVKSHGNLYIAARPLRQALYAKLGVGANPVLECFPIWDDNLQKACFTTDLVCADAKLSELLRSPLAAVEKLFPRHLRNNKPVNVDSVSWKNHVFAMHSIVFEICIESGQCKSTDSLLHMLANSRLC